MVHLRHVTHNLQAAPLPFLQMQTADPTAPRSSLDETAPGDRGQTVPLPADPWQAAVPKAGGETVGVSAVLQCAGTGSTSRMPVGRSDTGRRNQSHGHSSIPTPGLP